MAKAGRKMAKVGHKAKVVGRTVAKALAAGPTVAREAGQTAGKALAAAGLTAVQVQAGQVVVPLKALRPR